MTFSSTIHGTMFRKCTIIVCICFVILPTCKCIVDLRQAPRKFPNGFIFGAATASYQVEGAWDVDGKAESIWDHCTHNTPELIKDLSNGDVAADSYNKYKRDVEMLRELGVDFYRFSISWPRLLPSSFPDKINEAAVNYYNNLLDELLKNNIQPMVTLYHWDLPQKLQEMGGWANPHIVDWYVDYARVAFETFGDKVKYWVTVNEPVLICHYAYGEPYLAPAIDSPGVAEYLCSKNLLVAHAKAYRLYDEVYRPIQKGNISITVHSPWNEPETEADKKYADDALQFELGLYAHPIFSKTGDFPQVVKEKVAAKSFQQGLYRSRLPEFTIEEIDMLRGSSDFFGFNHYTTQMARNKSKELNFKVPSYFDDMEVETYIPEDWSTDKLSSKTVPWGFRKVLLWIKEEYDNPFVIVTENGLPTDHGLVDDDRIEYYRLYLDAMLDAIDEGANVVGYSPWSLMDLFEWFSGYTVRFGLYEVDYESPERTRTPRKSAFVYKEIVRSRALDFSYEPDTSVMTIHHGDSEN